MIIRKSLLPTNSILNNNSEDKRYDYIDCFSTYITDPGNQINSTILGKAFFSSAPKWVEKLFTLRNKLVSLLGLKTSGEARNREELLNIFKCQKGDQLGLFRIYDKTENEVILGEDDRHLNFRISLYLDNSKWSTDKTKIISISTVVHFNNLFGKIYFIPVRPFHRLIVPSMLKVIVEEMESSGLLIPSL